MTHTNHRTGTRETLEKDYVVFIYGAKGVNTKDAGPHVQKFFDLAQMHHPVNFGTPFVGNEFTMSSDDFRKGLSNQTKAYAVFDKKENAAALVEDLKEADTGISIVVSGLIDEVQKFAKTMDITPHTAQCSLGVWGKVDKLPEQEILDITTECGHAMISSGLVRRMSSEVKSGRISLRNAAIKLAKPCLCGVFNTALAEELLKKCIAAGIKE
jgi:hypothetical protein